MSEVNNNFESLQLSQEVMRAIEELGFKEATVIQSKSIPVIMSGKDVIGHSQTGTGKTAAFGIPAIERIDSSKRGKTQVLVLCPTRELAMQSCEEMRKFAKYKSGISMVPVYGGQLIDHQIRGLKKGAEIVVGTPGRVMDHMRRKTLKLDDLSMIILDEADEMLNMGFREDIETILQDVPKNRQTLLFSATMSQEIMRITDDYLTEPVLVKVAAKEMTVDTIEQFYYDVPRGRKNDVLARLVDFHNSKRSMIFCNTKKMVDELVTDLKSRGYSAEGLHGDMKQASRTQVMDQFKSGYISILVATDVAARGIDVDNIDVVFNYDLPQDLEYYVHRIGRTGRAGKKGASFSLVSGGRQIMALRDIERMTKSKVKLGRIPSLSDIEKVKNEKFKEDIKLIIERGVLDRHKTLIEKLVEEGNDPVLVASAILKLHFVNDKDSTINPEDDIIMSDRYESDRKRGPKQRAGKDKSGFDIGKAFKETLGINKKRSNVSMTSFMLNVGKKDNVRPNHVLGAVAGETGIPGKQIGGIDIHETYTLVDVPKEHADLVNEKMRGVRICGKRVTVEAVKKKSSK